MSLEGGRKSDIYDRMLDEPSEPILGRQSLGGGYNYGANYQEINAQNFWTVHEDVKESIDLFLRNNSFNVQRRTFSLFQEIKITLNRFSIRSKSLSFANHLNWFWINSLVLKNR